MSSFYEQCMNMAWLSVQATFFGNLFIIYGKSIDTWDSNADAMRPICKYWVYFGQFCKNGSTLNYTKFDRPDNKNIHAKDKEQE